MTWFLKAADAGNGLAMEYIGDMYVNGSGVAVDRGAAEMWYERAIKAGDSHAAERLRALQ
jgi:TPR repeat protein